jgi:hypothetical protein
MLRGKAESGLALSGLEWNLLDRDVIPVEGNLNGDYIYSISGPDRLVCGISETSL